MSRARFSIASYNVLADSYVRPDWFPKTPAALLEPGARTSALADRVAGLGVDIVCLQEVEPEVFAAVERRLGSAWGSAYARKGRGKPDGCATFVSERLSWKRATPHHYADGTGHLALVAVLELAGVELAVANTHVRWSPADSPEAEHHGHRQLGELLAARDQLAAGARWVVCGDLNLRPGAGPLARLEAAGFSDAFAGRPEGFTTNSAGGAKRIDYIFYGAGLSCLGASVETIDGTTPLPSDKEPSDHLPVVAELALA